MFNVHLQIFDKYQNKYSTCIYKMFTKTLTPTRVGVTQLAHTPGSSFTVFCTNLDTKRWIWCAT